MAERRPLHKVAHSICPHPNWSACDKARDEAYTDWQAMQQVILAYNIVVGGRARSYKKDDTQFGQLVQYINGDRDQFTNADGNESQAPFVLRIVAAIERFKAGDLPVYNLYRPAVPAQQEDT